jgi:hypothetical protein
MGRPITDTGLESEIAASKRKGMWMGGVVPLGYSAIDRKLLIEEAESESLSARSPYRRFWATAIRARNRRKRTGTTTMNSGLISP